MSTAAARPDLSAARFYLFGTVVKVVDVAGLRGWATPANSDGRDRAAVRLIMGWPHYLGSPLAAA
jgi:hypothetical protein